MPRSIDNIYYTTFNFDLMFDRYWFKFGQVDLAIKLGY